jgi:LmbE family N-acetylglucosaminyl deacetylase
MLELELGFEGDRPPRILCLGAHADDIEIGCGGTVLELVERYPAASFTWVVLSAGGERRREAAESADRFLAGAGAKAVVLRDFRDGFFPYCGAEIKGFFEELKAGPSPDLILTHHRGDLHQDHRLVCELTWNTFREHLILEYEIPKYDGDLGAPNAFVALAKRSCERKASYLLEHYASQRAKAWFSEETFLAVLRLRGIESRSGSGYAEGFYARKLRLRVGERAP